jgi:hypothetical protein
MKKKETYLAIGEEPHKRACISLGTCVLIEEVLAVGTNNGDEVRRQGRETERVRRVFLSDEQSVFLCYAVEEKDKSRESHQGSTGAFVSGARKFSMRLKLFLFFLWKPCDGIKS